MNEVRAFACRLLARREYSVGELRRKLQAKWPGREDIDSTVDQLQEERLLSDRRFAQGFVRSRVARFQGPRKIRAELMHRSVPEADIEAAMEEAGGRWADLALEWLARQGGGADDYETRAKYYRRLVNRGFTHDQAMDALKRSHHDPQGV